MKVYKRRSHKGSVIAELGPALIFLLLFMFIPAINLLGLGVTYFSCYVLNDLELHQACLVSEEVALSPKGPVNKAMLDWRTSGLGQFVNPVTEPETALMYREGESYADGKRDVFVIVRTKVRCRPFLNMPMFTGVPGLGSPMEFNIQKEGYCENPSVLGT